MTTLDISPQDENDSSGDGPWLRICRAVGRLLGTPACGVVLPAAESYVSEINLALDGKLVRRTLRRARSTARTTLDTSRPALVPDLRLTDAMQETKVPDGVISFGATPLIVGGVMGALWVGDIVPRTWTDQDRSRLEDAAQLLGDLLPVVALDGAVSRPRQNEQSARGTVEHASEAIGSPAAGMAHDFNNLLTAIKGTTQLLLQDFTPDDPTRRNLVTLDDAADRAARLARQLLALERSPEPAVAGNGVPASTILVVEDDESVRAFARRALERLGHRVLEADGADGAFDLIARTADPIDLVITDIVMPGMSGRELAVRLSIEHPGIRLLLMSGHGDEAAAVQGEGELPFLQKPFSVERLADSIGRALAAR